MKKVNFLLVCIFLINSINCFAQTIEKDTIEFKSKTKYVYGYSTDFKDALTMGITFEKIISPIDTTYYINFLLHAPSSDYRTDICFSRASTITFLAKSGKLVDLKLTDVKSLIKYDNHLGDPIAPVKVHYNSTTLILEVTKEELILISSDPFYKILLPYFNCSSKVYNKIEFTKPTLFTNRKFMQKNIYYILDI